MQKAAAVAIGEMLLFTDADIVHDPRCVGTALAEVDRRGLISSAFSADEVCYGL